jgi:hypothetical protein
MNLLSIALRTSVLAGVFLASFPIDSNPASAQQRACVITDEGNTVCGKLTTQPKKPSSGSGYRKEVKNYIFVLKSCKRSDTTIKCSLIVTNRGAEEYLSIDASNYSSIVDSNGKSYSGSTVDAGGNTDSSMHIKIAPGIDYTVDITFEKIPEQIAKVPLLKLYLNGEVQFRNVSFLN